MNWCCFWGQQKMQQSWHPQTDYKGCDSRKTIHTSNNKYFWFYYWYFCVLLIVSMGVYIQYVWSIPKQKSALKLEIIVSFDVYWKLNYFFLWNSNKCSYTLRHLSFPLLFYFKLSFYNILWEFLLIWSSRFSFYHQNVLHYCM